MINLVKRNLEQQVLKNQYDIEALKQLGMPGVKITDVVDSLEYIIQPIVGAFYLVKNAQNTYNLYIYTTNLEFVDMGEFPKEGPQGLMGLQGPKGETGVSTRWYSGLRLPDVKDSKAGDMFLDISTCQIYMFNGSIWVSKVNIKGAAGKDGNNGMGINEITATHSESAKETTIAINYTNNQTVSFDIPDGKPGAGFHIKDTLTYTTPLPNDIIDTLNADYPPTQRDYSEAILVKCVYLDNSQTIQKSYVFVIVDGQNGKEWDNAGQIESVKGDPGKDGNEIINSQDIIPSAVSGQPDNYKQLFIDNIPYLTSAPTSDNPIQQNRKGFKIVVLPKSLENETVKYNGYLYIFKEE